MTNLKPNHEIKKIKVGELHTPAKNAFVGKSTFVPSIRISGKYLIELGFKVNDVFTLTPLQNGVIQLAVVAQSPPDLKSEIMKKFDTTEEETDIMLRHADARIFHGDAPEQVLNEEFHLSSAFISALGKPS